MVISAAGRDAPGLNEVIPFIVFSAINRGCEVYIGRQAVYNHLTVSNCCAK